MAAKYTGKTDKQWHAHLMCKLSDMLRDEELRTLKQVISMAEEVPQNEIAKCNDFYIFWSLLERLGMIRLGEYGVLIHYLDMLHRQDCVHVIEEHTTKIEEYRQGKNCQPGPSTQTELFEPMNRQMVEEIVHSKFQELHKNQPTLPSSAAAVGPSPLPAKPTRTPQASTRVVRAPASAGINKPDENGYTDLLKAAREYDIGLVRSLLQSGADPDCSDEDGTTALICASWKGYDEIVTALLKNNADVNLIDKGGWTALMYACSEGHTEIVAALVENGADVNFENEEGITALDYAKVKGPSKIVKMLMVAGSKR